MQKKGFLLKRKEAKPKQWNNF